MSSVVVVWQFRHEVRSGYDEDRERLALRLIAISFFVLATYIIFESLRDLLFTDNEADESVVGIVLAALSLLVMPALGANGIALAGVVSCIPSSAAPGRTTSSRRTPSTDSSPSSPSPATDAPLLSAGSGGRGRER